MSLRKDASRIRELIRPERSRYLRGLAALFIVNACDALSPVFLAVAVDLTATALGGPAPETPLLMRLVGLDAAAFTMISAIVAYLALHLLSNAGRYPMLMNVAVPSHQIGQGLRNTMTAKFLRLAQPFYDKARSGDLMSHATSDIQATRMMLGPGVLVGSDTLMIATLVILVLLSLSWQLTLIAMIPLPIIAIVTNWLSHHEYKRFGAVQDDLASLTERVRESYAGLRILQGYAREDHDRRRFDARSQQHLQINLELAKIRSLLMPTLNLMLGMSTVLVLIFGGLSVVRGEISVGTFVAFLFLVDYLSGPMMGFGWSVSLFQRGRASLRRIDTLLATPETVFDDAGAVDLPGVGAIELRDIHFTYPGAESPALSGVTLALQPGETLGIIGPVAGGKSTLASLLVRLYNPPRGTVFIDGIDVRDARLGSIRETVVLAPQDTFLFSDTVARNIAVGRNVSLEQVHAFARQSQLHDELLELSDGYDTMLGERGVNLSGGQRQRLAIARTLATDPRVLILDDCLSAVDAKTEEAILASLREMFAGRTGIIISHRVCAVQGCDRVIVLDAGQIMESGTHQELIAFGGSYAALAEEQGRQDADNDADNDAGTDTHGEVRP
ncbi:MAG: ATP-binding cassette subfamily B multidrug efflux pump [Bradymonadia bacterium]|jgi:ATP-binding cassette subfamily B multidrug efflux pump